MTEFQIEIERAVSWFGEKAKLLKNTDITMAEVHANSVNVPSARADFDSENFIGRISIWATGEIDFEVLKRSDGEFSFFRHETVSKLQTPVLDHAYDEFVRSMGTAKIS